MKTFIADIIPKIRRYSQKLDNITLLTNQHWVVIDELRNSKFVYIFRSNSELLISQNGKVEKGKWEYLGNNSLLIERKGESYLFRHGFFDSNVLALKVDGLDEYAFLVNENNHGGELNSIDKVLVFLEKRYLNMIPLNQLLPGDNVINAPDVRNKLALIPMKNQMNKYGFVNSDGDLVIDFRYDFAKEFSEGLALVFKTVKGRDLYGFIDELGNEVIPLKHEYALCFKEGLAVVRKNRLFGYINKEGKVVIDFIYDDADPFTNGTATVREFDRFYLIDQRGCLIKELPQLY